jgi:signal peptidase II
VARVIPNSAKLALVLAIGSTIALVDQLTKEAAIADLTPNRTVPVWGDILGWYLTYNDSAAFSIGFGVTWIFTIISSIALLAVLWRTPRIQTTGWLVLAGMLVGGISGNLIDRLTRAPGFGSGQVVDFIQIPFNFPIFNVADIFITSTMFIVALLIIRGHKIGGAQSA